jgi:bacterioferritin-associated ferredoxin
MIICVCHNVNEAAIRRAVRQGHDNYASLQFELGVGTCCGQCKQAVHETVAQCKSACMQTPAFETMLRPVLNTIRIQPVSV